jgi:serine/threonine protein phosphatase PrpC
MQCLNCGHQNRPGASFCNNCGQPLRPPVLAPMAPAEEQIPPVQVPPVELGMPEGVPEQPPAAQVSSMSPTKPLPEGAPEQPPSDFAPLPQGGIIGGRFHIVDTEPRVLDAQKNIYLVETLEPLLICPQCGYSNPAGGELVCANCGVSLDAVQPFSPRYLARETWDSRLFAAETAISEKGLTHPGLYTYECFTETPYDNSQRYYQLLPEYPPPLALSTVRPPVEVHQLLSWGVQLAQAMAYLHQNFVAIHRVDNEHITIEGKQARWFNFGEAAILDMPQQQQQLAPRLFAEDVAKLVGLLYYWLTGEQVYRPDLKLPPQVGQIFERGLLATPQAFASAADLARTLEEVLNTIRRPTSFNLRLGRLTDVGRARTLNEDSLLTVEAEQVCQSVIQLVGLYAVADGMGGHARGDVASRVIVNTLAQHMAQKLAQWPADEGQGEMDGETWLREAVLAANKAVLDYRHSARSDMGSTLVAALVLQNTAYIANIGDSRAYLINDQGIRQVTTDHSLIERLIAAGQVTREEARYHPQRNVIYRTMGDKAKLEVDTFVQPLAPGDRLLLCSDGLSGMITDEQILAICRKHAAPQEACRELVEAANQAGGDDNITAIILQGEEIG